MIWMQCRIKCRWSKRECKTGDQESRLEVHGDVGEGLLEWRDWKYCI